MIRIAQFVLFVTLLVLRTTSAGTPVLGYEVGVATQGQVKAALEKKTKVSEVGTNEYSRGPMLRTDGSAYEFEGLNEVTFIFDDQKKLAGVLMMMSKFKFDTVFQALSKKYKVASHQRPLVGNQFARFNTPDTVIEHIAPHLSFDMNENYIRSDLMKKFLAQSTADAESKKKREAENF